MHASAVSIEWFIFTVVNSEVSSLQREQTLGPLNLRGWQISNTKSFGNTLRWKERETGFAHSYGKDSRAFLWKCYIRLELKH